MCLYTSSYASWGWTGDTGRNQLTPGWSIQPCVQRPALAKLRQPPNAAAACPHSPSERAGEQTQPSILNHATHKLCPEKLSRSSFKISDIQEEMPAKENVLLLSESANQTILIRKDVDNLVQNIKENLKLTQYEAGVQCAGLGGQGFPTSLPDFSDYPTAVSDSGPLKSRSFVGSRASRASPYGLVAKNAKCECIETAGGGPAVKRSSWAARKRYPSMSANGKPKAVELEDPLEMLHELIR